MIDEYGNEIIYDVLFTFDNESNGKSYIVYTENFRDEKGHIEVYASIISGNNNTKLIPVETEEEWCIIESILNDLQQGFRRTRKYS